MKKFTVIRYSILLFFLALFTIFSLRHFVLGGETAASVDALCPFGGFETLITLLTSGRFVPRVMVSSLILSFGLLMSIIFFKRGFCGWICPFGTVQELLGKLKKKKTKIPKKYDTKARYLKYGVLAFAVIGAGLTGTLVFRQYDPFMTFFHFGKGILWNYEAEEFASHITAFILTIGVLIFSVFISRFWCKYFCPLGAGMGILSKFSFLKLKNNTKKCTKCKTCSKVCPANIQIHNKKEVKDAECITCGKCVNACPEKSLSFNLFGNKISILFLLIGVLLLFFAPVFMAKMTDTWHSVPNLKKITENVEQGGAGIDPNEISGWMTIEEVSKASGVCLSHLYREFQFPQDLDPKTPLKEVKNYGIDFHTEDLREFLRNFTHDEGEEQHIESSENDIDCPWGIEEDKAPGLCGLYVDKDNNRICDLSE